ncbi:uncharacterized protein PAF06_007098, partial [Gastrophryne carolinensis]
GPKFDKTSEQCDGHRKRTGIQKPQLDRPTGEDLTVEVKAHAPQKSNSSLSTAKDHDSECRKESCSEREASKSQPCANIFSRELQYEGSNRTPGYTPNDKRNKGRKKNIFEPYLSKDDVSAGLKRGELIQGPLRINPKKFHEAFLPSPDGMRDIFIDGVASRNRALNGDLVVVKLLPRDQWKASAKARG